MQLDYHQSEIKMPLRSSQVAAKLFQFHCFVALFFSAPFSRSLTDINPNICAHLDDVSIEHARCQPKQASGTSQTTNVSTNNQWLEVGLFRRRCFVSWTVMSCGVLFEFVFLYRIRIVSSDLCVAWTCESHWYW